MPAEQLRSLIPQPVITSETVDDLADRFGHPPLLSDTRSRTIALAKSLTDEAQLT